MNKYNYEAILICVIVFSCVTCKSNTGEFANVEIEKEMPHQLLLDMKILMEDKSDVSLRSLTTPRLIVTVGQRAKATGGMDGYVDYFDLVVNNNDPITNGVYSVSGAIGCRYKDVSFDLKVNTILTNDVAGHILETKSNQGDKIFISITLSSINKKPILNYMDAGPPEGEPGHSVTEKRGKKLEQK